MTEQINVTQADRDAAQALCASGWTHAIEAFARHREAAEAASKAREAALVEALRWYADQMCEGLCQGKDPRACANIGADNCAGCPAVVALHKVGETA